MTGAWKSEAEEPHLSRRSRFSELGPPGKEVEMMIPLA